MNNQVKLIEDLEKVIRHELSNFPTNQTVVLGGAFAQLLDIAKHKSDTPPVPTIGCSECDYKGYFEYETGVVDEGTRIKEIAKEPCDCVIDRVPTIKPGDKVRITDALNRSCIGKEDIVTHISGSAPYSARLENFLGDWPFSSLEVVE